jgi:hypothetical protein
MSLYYVKRVRIPRGPERLRGLYAGARPSFFHSASPTTPVTHLPPQIPGGKSESSTVTLVPCTPPTEIPRPGGTAESGPTSPQSAGRNPSVAHASSLAGGGKVSLPLPQQVAESKIENRSSEISSFPSSSLPQLPPVNVPLFHSRKFASIRGCSSDGNTQKTQPQNTPRMPVFIAQNTLTQMNPNTPKPIENLSSDISSFPSSSFSRFALLPPVNIPFFHSRKFASIRGCFSPDRTGHTSLKKVYSRCIVGAVPKSSNPTREHRKDTVQNTLKSPIFIDQNTLHSQNTEPVFRHFFTDRTKPHHPHPLRTENSGAEISNSELPSPPLPQWPRLPAVNVPLLHLRTETSRVEISEQLASSFPTSVQAPLHSHPFASIRGCSSDGNTKKAQPQNTVITPVFIAQNTLTQLIPGGNLGRSPASSLPGAEPTYPS